MRTHSGYRDEHPAEDGKATSDGGSGDSQETDETLEAGETGDDDIDDDIGKRIRRASRALTKSHPEALERDLDRVRAGLGLDAESQAQDSTANPDAHGGDGPGGADLPPERPKRNLEREIMLAATREKLGFPKKPVVLGKYRIIDRIGGGGMGVVWKAVNPDINKIVALKLLRRGNQPGQTVGHRQRAREEASHQAKSKHRYVADVIDEEELDGQPYIVMEYVQGDTLADWRQANNPDQRTLISVYRKIALGLSAIHSAEISHGDFKHDNVIITRVDDELVPKIIDFGMALETGSGIIGGTPEYMAPEQLAPGKSQTTPISDQYAFCVALFEDLVGAHPYAGVSYDEFAETRRESEPNLSPDKLRYEYVETIRASLHRGVLLHEYDLRRLPRWLQKMLRRGLSPRASDRFKSMKEIVDLLGKPEVIAGRRKTVFTALAAGAVALMLASTAVDRTEEDPCAYVAASAQEIWGETIRGSLSEDLQGPAEALLAPHAKAWRDASAHICDEHHKQDGSTDHTFDVQRECLDHRMQDAEIALAGLKDGGNVIDLNEYLDPPELCRSVDQSTPYIPHDKRDAVLAAQSRLKTEVLSAELSREYAKGEKAATDLTRESLQLDYPPLIAESYYYRSRIALNRFLYSDRNNTALRARGEEWLNLALMDAASYDHALLIEALLYKLRYSGMVPDTPREPLAYAIARLQRLGLNEAGKAALSDSVAVHNLNLARFPLKRPPEDAEGGGDRRHEHEAAERLHEERSERLLDAERGFKKALTFYRRNNDQLMEAKALENLGITLLDQDNEAEAGKRFSEALDLWQKINAEPPVTLRAYVMLTSDDAPTATEVDIDKIVAECTKVIEAIEIGSSEEALAFNEAQLRLVCAGKTYNDYAHSVRYAFDALPDLPPENRIQALQIILHLDFSIGIGERTPGWLAQMEDRLDEFGPDRPSPEILLLEVLRGRLHLHRNEFSSAADRLAEARELMDQGGENATDSFTATVLLLDLAEAQLGAGQPAPADILAEAAKLIELHASDPQDEEDLALLERHKALSKTSPASPTPPH